MYHVRNRVYDPYQQRWLQRDPIGFAGGPNLYQYCMGDPIGMMDPMGLSPSDPFEQFGVNQDKLGMASARDDHAKDIIEEINEAPYHEILGYAGSAPIVGDAFDALNVALYLIEGDYDGLIDQYGGNGMPSVWEAYEAWSGLMGGGLLGPGPMFNIAQHPGQPRGGVYVLRDKSNKKATVYTGRTSDLKRRAGEHGRDPAKKRFEFSVRYFTDEYAEQRGLEQIEYDEITKRQGCKPKLNKQRPISDRNPEKKKRYMEKGREHQRREQRNGPHAPSAPKPKAPKPKVPKPKVPKPKIRLPRI